MVKIKPRTETQSIRLESLDSLPPKPKYKVYNPASIGHKELTEIEDILKNYIEDPSQLQECILSIGDYIESLLDKRIPCTSKGIMKLIRGIDDIYSLDAITNAVAYRRREIKDYLKELDKWRQQSRANLSQFCEGN